MVALQFDRPAKVAGTPRANPITHRHYDPTNLIKAFPDFRFTPLEEGIAKVHRESVRQLAVFIAGTLEHG